MKGCKISNCKDEHRAKGLCLKHYMDTYNKPYRERNREALNKKSKEYRIKHPEVIQKWRVDNKEHIKKWRKEYALKNPKSRHYQEDIDLQIAVNNVKIRDKNICQWQNCGLTHREAPIHVNHIFPKSEYPDLIHVEQYMICYCANHHGLWHRYRGDRYYKMIQSKSLIELEEERIANET